MVFLFVTESINYLFRTLLRILVVASVIAIMYMSLKWMFEELNEPIVTIRSPDFVPPFSKTTQSENILESSYVYYPGISISSPNTTIGSGSSNESKAKKCQIWGDQCIGFDEFGSLFLRRDLLTSKLSATEKGQGGFYIRTISEKDREIAKTLCEKIGGDLADDSSVCSYPELYDIDKFTDRVNNVNLRQLISKQ